jgi:glycosyltransferase involved in cell wall biosynthesis
MEEDRAHVWVVIPAFNEGPVIGGVVAQVVGLYPRTVVVDDASTDNTAALAARAGAVVVRHPINLGQGAALQTGITFALDAGARYIVTFDADGQHQTGDVERMLAALKQSGADIALGNRFGGEALDAPWSRRALLRLAVLFTVLTTRLRVSDAHNGLRVLSSAAAAKLHIRQNRMAHASEILKQIRHLGLRYIEVPVTIRYTSYSLSKGQGIGNALNILADLFMGRFVR